MERAPRDDGLNARECSVEQATSERVGTALPHARWRAAEPPIPFAVPERLQVVDSTNRYLVDLVADGLPGGGDVPAGHAVVAEAQSHGRGRRGRRWEAP